MSDEENSLPDLEKFSWLDFFVFVAMSVLCILIGIYFGSRKKAHSEVTYLMGGRKMKVLPIGFSLVSSLISGVTILGLPTEVYLYGTQYLYMLISILPMCMVVSLTFMPVLHNLHITTIYEYLERRFDRRLRLFGCVLSIIKSIGFMPIVLYIPALALNQVTGISVHLIEPIVCIICVFYTSLGGIKAVVWTDVVQTISMLGAVIVVVYKGSYDIGGVDKVLESAWNSERLEAPILSIDPTIRHTIWSQIIGGFLFWMQTVSLSQNMMQRYFSLPTLAAARQALYFFCIGVIVFMLLCGYVGLLIYATYEHCDPLTTKLAKSPDQLLPLFVMNSLGEIPGLTGVLIAGIFSATLSTLSTCFNSMSAIVLEDFVKPLVKTELSKNAVKWTMMLTVVVMGVLCVLLAYVVEHMGTVFQLTMSLDAITNGPLLGIFIIGIFMPCINGNSAFTGGVLSLIVMAWIAAKAQWAIVAQTLSYEKKEVSVDQCSYQFDNHYAMTSANFTEVGNVDDIETGFQLHRISYMWHSCWGFLINIIVAIILTYFFGSNDPKSVDPSLLAPFIRGRFHNNKEYKPVNTMELGKPTNLQKPSEEAIF